MTTLGDYSMKKSLLALAVLGAFAGAASAQQTTSVEVYGLVDMGFVHDDNGVKTINKIDSGIQSGSRLGFRGKEDLGNGLSAIFTLETGIAADTGGFTQGNAFARQSYVGLNGGFGTVKLGRQITPIWAALDSIDPFGSGLAGDSTRIFANAGGVSLYPLRMSNTINYSMPSTSGFSGEVAYGFGEVAGDTHAGREIGLRFGYANGPVAVQLAYDNRNTTTTIPAFANGALNADVKLIFLGGTYDFGVAKAHLAYQDNKLDTNLGDWKSRNILAGVSVPFGASTIMASYIRNDIKDFSNADSDQIAIGYTYALSKRTNLYTSYSRTTNDNNVAVNAGAAGKNDSLFNVGIRHKF